MRAEGRSPIRQAGRVVLVGSALGLAGQLLFFDVGLGVNFPLAIVLLLVGGWLTRSPRGRIHPLDAWLGPAAIALAAGTAVRADTTVLALDVVGSLALAGAALASFAGRIVVAQALTATVGTVVTAAGWLAGGAAPALGAARRDVPAGAFSVDRIGRGVPVLRGLLIATPIVFVFVVLLTSADAVFSRFVTDAIDVDLGDAPGRLVVAGVVGWIAIGGLALAAAAPPDSRARGDRLPAFRLGSTEAVTVLVAVNAVFITFVALQGAYLFGGLDTMAAAGLSYAEYARRGFFELLAVAVLATGLVIALERLVGKREPRIIGGGVALTALTGVILVSSAVRLRLYQEAYGWTELRIYVVAAIVVIGIVLVALAVSLVADRVRWIGHVAIVACLAVGLGLNVIGPVRLITEHNVARILDPNLVSEDGRPGLDEFYLTTLGDDAVPHLLRALPHLDEARAGYLRADLRLRLDELRRSPGLEAWQAWNLGREAARDALERAAEDGLLDER
jgi:hypothetical protein